jgi:hypothetical protein
MLQFQMEGCRREAVGVIQFNASPALSGGRIAPDH